MAEDGIDELGATRTTGANPGRSSKPLRFTRKPDSDRQLPIIDVTPLRTQKLNLTQEEFSVLFGLPLGTLKNWEQGRSTPDPFSRCFLAVINRDPERAQSVVCVP